jgi:hypothetical protein
MQAEVLWARQWDDLTPVKHWQTMFAVPLAAGNLPSVGVRVTISVNTTFHMANSYATAEVFDGTQWHPIAGLPAQLMKSAIRHQGGMGAVFSTSGAEEDAAQLLQDTQTAYRYRAPGPSEFARVIRQ